VLARIGDGKYVICMYTIGMDEETREKIQEIDKKLDSIYRSVEKTRKYFQWTMIVTLIVVVLPLVGLLFVIPSFLSLYSGGGDINQTLDLLGL